MKKILFFVLLSVCGSVHGQNLNFYQVISEVRIDSCTYRIVQNYLDPCDQKVLYPQENKWKSVPIYTCDTTGCTQRLIVVNSICREKDFLKINFSWEGKNFTGSIYLTKKGFPDWNMNSDEEDWRRD